MLGSGCCCSEVHLRNLQNVDQFHTLRSEVLVCNVVHKRLLEIFMYRVQKFPFNVLLFFNIHPQHTKNLQHNFTKKHNRKTKYNINYINQVIALLLYNIFHRLNSKLPCCTRLYAAAGGRKYKIKNIEQQIPVQSNTKNIYKWKMSTIICKMHNNNKQ